MILHSGRPPILLPVPPLLPVRVTEGAVPGGRWLPPTPSLPASPLASTPPAFNLLSPDSLTPQLPSG